ncbi:MAG: protein kinase, partial [Candidatus Eisenbacteria bacterium]|nr:protein kinase [Candidatus Eisenbacteria bacterium]
MRREDQRTADPRSIPILERLDRGESTEALLPELYQELRGLARHYMQHERSSHTLQPTALVHEAYLRLLGEQAAQSRTRLQFLAAASRAMRQILIEHARARGRHKRGGGRTRVSLHDDHWAAEEPIDDLIAIGDGLEALAAEHPRQAKVVELLYFGGLTAAEAAEVLDVTSRTVERDWKAARAWLAQRILAPHPAPSDPAGPGGPERRRPADQFLTLPPRPIATTSTEPTHPIRIGRYRVLDELGRGSGGVVYRAHDDDLARDIAIKVLPQARGRDWSDRLRREARILAALNHPNIATVYSLEHEEDRLFVTMELVAGHTLEQLLRAGALPVPFSVELARQIARALEAARKQGVVHCDLSPANVKIGPDGMVKVLDFGLARGLHAEADPQEDKFLAGTPGYLSPEQIAGQEPDHRADVWALGCLLYECLSGRAAFPGDRPVERLAAAQERDPDWSALPTELPRRLRELLALCLQKDPDSRLDTVRIARRELEEELARFRSPEPAPRPSSYRHNLPVPTDAFVGRERELQQIVDLLAGAADHTADRPPRLVTLVGAGGCGKSRLAIEVGWKLSPLVPGEVRFVDVSSCRDRAQAVRALALASGVRESAGQDLLDAIDEDLAENATLLLFDGCEHLAEPLARLFAHVLNMHPEVRILATSRERMRLPGELLCEVKPLSIPRGGTKQDVLGSDAGRLFLGRLEEITRHRPRPPDYRSIAEICRHLDGIPLAIELAAARTRTLPLAEIAQRLDDRFRLLTSGSRTAQPRHRTLRAMVDWSHTHLTEVEQRFFRRLAGFAGSFSLAAAESVCAGEGIEEWQVLDLLTALIDKSLVEVQSDGEHSVRYRTLETIAHYARERLEEAAESVMVQRRLLDRVREWTTELAPHLKGAGVRAKLDELARDYPNLMRALESALALDEIGAGLEIVAALDAFWTVRG